MLSADKKDEVAKVILDVLIKLLEKKKITDEQGREMAKVATEEIYKAKNDFDLPKIYSVLSQKWPIFKSNEIIELGNVDKKEETEVAKGVEELIRAGKLDRALMLARTETEDDK